MLSIVSLCGALLVPELHLQRPRNGSDAVHTTNQTHVGRTLVKRYGVADNENGTREDTSSADASNGTANDESSRVGRNTANQGANLKDGQCRQIHPFNRVESVEFAVDELCCARGQQI